MSKEARELAQRFGVRMCDENGMTHGEELYCLGLDDIIAMKEALAKQEQGEPVAWQETCGKVVKALARIVNVHTPDKLFDLNAIPRDPVMVLVQDIKDALYKYKPTPQRTWVGLTEAEVDKCYESIMFNPDIEPTRMGVYLGIEAKLKEKNT